MIFSFTLVSQWHCTLSFYAWFAFNYNLKPDKSLLHDVYQNLIQNVSVKKRPTTVLNSIIQHSVPLFLTVPTRYSSFNLLELCYVDGQLKAEIFRAIDSLCKKYRTANSSFKSFAVINRTLSRSHIFTTFFCATYLFLYKLPYKPINMLC